MSILIESKVNQKVKEWGLANGYTYKGVTTNGEVPVPTTFGNDVKIDAQLEKAPKERIWIEGKGEVGVSTLIQGLGRVAFAVYYGGGKGLLAIDHERTQRLLKYEAFLKWFAEGVKIGIFDVEQNNITWI